MTCDARIRPFPNNTEIRCELPDGHPDPNHHGVLRDYAHPGSRTAMTWADTDRRNFVGDWPGRCPAPCILPIGHRGNCAT